ncbi:MAG: ribosome maturation factor RimM [Gemmatimonadaceae bacterium]|nr:ribosome maturation factor RimM [Gemmatimonadaceae bacterium]
MLEPLSDAPDAIFVSGRSLLVGDRDGALLDLPPMVIDRVRPFKDGYLAHLGGIADRDAAERWRGRTLLAALDDVPPPDEDQLYYHLILGMRVQDATGADVGPVIELYDLPAGLTLEIETATGKKLVPYIPELVEYVDEDARVIRLKHLDGLLD